MAKLDLDPEGYCPANDHPRWNQSCYFNFYDPKTKIGCFIRAGILENAKEANNWFLFFRDGEPLFTRLNMHLGYTKKRLKDGINIGGVKIRALKPLETAHISFDHRDFKVDLTWQAILPMQDAMHLTGPGKNEAFVKAIAHVHMEGTCRVTGTITLANGEIIEIDGKGFRDLAVGPRDWDLLERYRLAWPIFDNGLSIVATHGMSVTGQDGYIRMVGEKGKWIAVKDVQDNNTYEKDGITIKGMDWKVTDAKNRVHAFTAKRLFVWTFPFDTYVLTEHMMEFTLADGTKGYGLGECGFRLPLKHDKKK